MIAVNADSAVWQDTISLPDWEKFARLIAEVAATGTAIDGLKNVLWHGGKLGPAGSLHAALKSMLTGGLHDRAAMVLAAIEKGSVPSGIVPPMKYLTPCAVKSLDCCHAVAAQTLHRPQSLPMRSLSLGSNFDFACDKLEVTDGLASGFTIENYFDASSLRFVQLVEALKVAAALRAESEAFRVRFANLVFSSKFPTGLRDLQADRGKDAAELCTAELSALNAGGIADPKFLETRGYTDSSQSAKRNPKKRKKYVFDEEPCFFHRHVADAVLYVACVDGKYFIGKLSSHLPTKDF